MTRVAAVDLGTITTRLLLLDTEDGRSPRGERHNPITRLGAGLDAAGRLAPEAIERVRTACVEHRRRLDAFEPDGVRVVATSAARDATNREELFAAVQESLGWPVELLSGLDEGRLAFAGAVTGLDGEPSSSVVLLDIGGGSTEFSVGTGAGVDDVFSADIGASRVTDAYLHHDPPWAEDLSAALSVVQLHLDDARRELPGLTESLADGIVVGVGGTLTTIAAVEIGLSTYDPDRIHGFVLRRNAVEDVFRTVATESREDRRHNPGLPEERVDLIVGGCIVLVEAMRHLEIDEICVSETDLLDGVAAELLGSTARH